MSEQSEMCVGFVPHRMYWWNNLAPSKSEPLAFTCCLELGGKELSNARLFLAQAAERPDHAIATVGRFGRL